jgi:hypothetical protein
MSNDQLIKQMKSMMIPIKRNFNFTSGDYSKNVSDVFHPMRSGVCAGSVTYFRVQAHKTTAKNNHNLHLQFIL